MKKQTYVVERGDTLTAIAKKFGTTVAQIAADNNIKNVNLIHVGRVLTIITKEPDDELREVIKTVLSDVENLESFKKLVTLLDG